MADTHKTIVCERCQNVVSTSPSKVGRKKFCSFECKHAGVSARSDVPRDGDYCIDPNTGCWLWMRGYGSNGYGEVKPRLGGLAHRFYYMHFKGPIPDGTELDHLCRNRGCVNPAHLEAVTRSENHRRGLQGKLTAADVREIHAMRGMKHREMAAKFGIDQSTVTRILGGTRHKDVCHR